MTAVAYIRRSASEESPVSEQAQRDTVAMLAAERGDTIAHVFRDWGQSGASESRPQFLAMLAQAEADGIHAIYAYDQGRLARSNFLFASLLRLADLRGFSIITPAGDLTDENRRDFAEMRGLMDSIELRKMRKRSRAIAAKRRSRGDDMGQLPYGYSIAPHEPRPSEPIRYVRDEARIAHVVETYKRIGTYIGTARALNAEGWPTQRGRSWHPVTVQGILQREAPGLTTPVRKGTRGPGRPRLLAGLLVCHCGGPMTPGISGKGTMLYYCGRGQRGAHPAPHGISESRLSPWVREEADRLVDPDEYYTEGPEYDDSQERQEVAALRARGRQVAADALEADLDAERAAHGERIQQALDVPDRIKPDWWNDPAHTQGINRALRSLWEYVDLGADLLPVRAAWRVPEWRQDT